MTNNTPDSDAESTTRSLSIPTPTSVQLLERDVACPYSTLIEEQSSEKMRETVTILISLLRGFTEEVMSGDVVYFACERAIEYCVAAGMDRATAKDTIKRFMAIAKENRKRNPISSMF